MQRGAQLYLTIFQMTLGVPLDHHPYGSVVVLNVVWTGGMKMVPNNVSPASLTPTPSFPLNGFNHEDDPSSY